MEKFNVTNTELAGTNLIEASAGTGKTYSIALLVIRLIVEKGMEITRILMVTFTNAAVAELEGRIREFIRMSYDYVTTRNDAGLTGDLKQILDHIIASEGSEKAKRNLHRSLLYLDETSIFTIHSFCQRTLTEFAFETNQPFEHEIASDTMIYVEEAVHKFWRENITVIDTQLLKLLIEEKLSLQRLKKFVKDKLSEPDIPVLESEQRDALHEQINRMLHEVDETWQRIEDYYEGHLPQILESCQSGRQKQYFLPIAENKDDFLSTYKKKLDNDSPPGYMSEFLPELGALMQTHLQAEDELSESLSIYRDYLLSEALWFARKVVGQMKQARGLLFYDDLILSLQQAVNGPNKTVLKKALNAKYRAVFIDEFHDTDRHQYDIFSKVFIGHCPVFLIGDPKQSIYAFRGADIETYKEAARESDRQYTMDRNYRSTAGYIQALNAIYRASEDPFMDMEIGYMEVKAGREVGKLLGQKGEVVPVAVIPDSGKEDAYPKVALEVNRLLTSGYRIKKDGHSRKVRPSDIAILVRSNHDSPKIKQALVRLGIPAITSDDTLVLQSDEAREVFYILKAILEPKKGHIKRALASVFTGKTNEEILGMDDQAETERFRKLFDTLTRLGIYGALMQFAKDYRVKGNSLRQPGGERIISNFLQTAELLQKRQIEMGHTPEQLLTWLQRIMEGEATSGDEYEQRVESDENAVIISSIHRSKGLAYNIVFAPFLNMKPKDGDRNVLTPEDPDYLPNEQENRRLMYVALTRAVYKCYINITSSTKGQGSIHHFEAAIASVDPALVEYLAEEDEALAPFTPETDDRSHPARQFTGQIDNSWRILSFSGLSRNHDILLPDEAGTTTDAYDEFMFNRLPKGPVAGLFLHEVFEHIDFPDSSGWERAVLRAGNKYGIPVEQDTALYLRMIRHVLLADYRSEEGSFNLGGLPANSRINEMEFYFNLDQFRTERLKELIPTIAIDRYTYGGAMHGFVDMFFEMNGKFYVLDWKSNFLGNALSSYLPQNLEMAMTANNYHLQYIIYTIAVKRYLESRMHGFDYAAHFGGIFYVFLRGCREGSISGLFRARPEVELIRQVDEVFRAKADTN